jgi:hypothetical protein
MSIVLEEEQVQKNWFGIITVIVVVAIVFIGSYYLFFKKPELIDVVLPSGLENLNQLSQITALDPQAVVNSSNFKMLRDFTSPLVLPAAGRSNPFRL